MATELFRTRCTQGKLIITDEYIRVEAGGFRQQTLSRSALVGIDSRMGSPSFFGLGGGTNMVFRGPGTEVIKANLVPPKAAKQILRLLGY